MYLCLKASRNGTHTPVGAKMVADSQIVNWNVIEEATGSRTSTYQIEWYPDIGILSMEILFISFLSEGLFTN